MGHTGTLRMIVLLGAVINSAKPYTFSQVHVYVHLSPRKQHPVLRAERAEKDRFSTGQKNYFLGCLMKVKFGVVK